MKPSERLAQIWQGQGAARTVAPYPDSATISWQTEEPTDGGLYLVRYIEPGSTFQRIVSASRRGHRWAFYIGDNQLAFIPPGAHVIAVASLAPLFVAP